MTFYQQENQLFADHKDAWDKAFGLMNKNAAGDDKSGNYADTLASTVESNKDSFSKEEYETLCKDIETIRGIEEEIAKLEKEIAASDSSDSSSSKSNESSRRSFGGEKNAGIRSRQILFRYDAEQLSMTEYSGHVKQLSALFPRKADKNQCIGPFRSVGNLF